MPEKDFREARQIMMGQKTEEETGSQAALILPGTSSGLRSVVFCVQVNGDYLVMISASKRHYSCLRDSHEFYDTQKAFPRSRPTSDGEESAKIIAASSSLSALLIPSLKEVSPPNNVPLNEVE